MKNKGYKVIYIDYNFVDKRYPNSVEHGDSFFTYGFGALYARKFKKYNPDIEVECWKTDPRIDKIYEKTIENVKFIVFPSKSFGKLGQYSRALNKYLKNYLKTNPKTIFNVSSIRHLLFYSIAFLLKKTPLVVQHHGEATAIYKYKINKGLKKLWYALQIPVEWYAFKSVDLFFVLDKNIIQYLPKSNKKIKIELSTTGVDEELFRPLDKIEAKKILGWDINKKHILYVGRLNYTKRPDILIDIYEEFKKEGKNDIELVLAGNEIDDPLYERAVKSGAIIYGKILQNELFKYLSAADVYCLPRYATNHLFGGIGLLPVQAMLCNTPVVGGSIRNYAGKNVNEVGIFADDYVSIKNAILKILDQKIKFNNLRENALSIYSWEKISLNTRYLYDELIKKYVKK